MQLYFLPLKKACQSAKKSDKSTGIKRRDRNKPLEGI